MRLSTRSATTGSCENVRGRHSSSARQLASSRSRASSRAPGRPGLAPAPGGARSPGQEVRRRVRSGTNPRYRRRPARWRASRSADVPCRSATSASRSRRLNCQFRGEGGAGELPDRILGVPERGLVAGTTHLVPAGFLAEGLAQSLVDRHELRVHRLAIRQAVGELEEVAPQPLQEADLAIGAEHLGQAAGAAGVELDQLVEELGRRGRSRPRRWSAPPRRGPAPNRPGRAGTPHAARAGTCRGSRRTA